MAPSSGVLTKFGFREGSIFSASDESVRLQVWRAVGGGTFTLVSESDAMLFQKRVGVVTETTARLSIQAGDVIGARFAGDGSGNTDYHVTTLSTADVIHRFGSPPPAVGGNAASAGNFDSSRVNIRATLEPDADGDGYGDETQDSCPSRADIQAVCPPDVSAVSLTRKKFKVNKRGAVISVGKGTTLKFTLAGPATTRITVQRLVKRKWRKTHSFLRTLAAGANSIDYSGRYKSRGKKRVLEPGSYRFSVVATNESGSATVLSGKFKVVK